MPTIQLSSRSRARLPASRLTALGLTALALTAPAATAQVYGNGSDGPLLPTANVTLNTTPNGGVFQFTTIQIPAGVTVRLTGNNPATLLCTGAVTIAGRLEVDGEGSHWSAAGFVNGSGGGPGGFDGGGYQQNGSGPGGGPAGICLNPAISGGCASHATPGSTANNPCIAPAATYGTALPFDLQGGSGGGGSGAIASQSQAGPPASGGGGAIAILAEGSIDVAGTVSARGGDIVFESPYGLLTLPSGRGGNGSGGAILLRALQSVTISGTVDASGGVTSTPGGGLYSGGDGFIRIDSYRDSGAPNLTGATIQPAPTVVAMPFLTDLSPARIGQIYPVRCAAPPGDVLGFYYSFGTGSVPVPPFGVLELDPTMIFMLGQYTVPTTVLDPLARIDITIPNVLSLVGIIVHAQTFNAFGTVATEAQLSNRLSLTLQN